MSESQLRRMELPGKWCYALAAVAIFGALLLSAEVSGQEQGDGTANATSGKAICTSLIEMIVMRSAALYSSPRADSSLAVTFSLFTRRNPKRQEILRTAPNGEVLSYYYDPQRDTKFIIHGFLGRGTHEWIEMLRDALLLWADVNVIVVDWNRAASNPYPQAAVNTAIVGQRIAQLITALTESYGGDTENFHLIGHSLGAHVAGYAGGLTNGLGRITASHRSVFIIPGLDPAGPLFSLAEINNRLDPSDANFVDNIHTDKDCLGMRMPSGHVDFYPNGGTEQPGCGVVENRRDNYIGGTLASLDASFCSHFRAVKLFIESIVSSPFFNATGQEVKWIVPFHEQCQFIGVLCDSYENFLRGSCDSSDSDSIRTALMGIDADIFPGQNTPNPPPRTYFLLTNAVKPYCML